MERHHLRCAFSVRHVSSSNPFRLQHNSIQLVAITFPACSIWQNDSLNTATEQIEAEQTRAVPEHLKNKHFPVNPES